MTWKFTHGSTHGVIHNILVLNFVLDALPSNSQNSTNTNYGYLPSPFKSLSKQLA